MQQSALLLLLSVVLCLLPWSAVSQITAQPTLQPTQQPTRQPTRFPTGQPTGQPTRRPTGQPTLQPTGQPSSHPTHIPRVVTWIPDSISIAFGNVSFVGPTSATTLQNSGWKLNITTQSNGPIYQKEPAGTGHFKLKFYMTTVDYGHLAGTTVCIRVGASSQTVNSIIGNTIVRGSDGVNNYEFLLSQLMTVQTKKFYDLKSTVSAKNTYIVHMDGAQELEFNAYMMKSGCGAPRTIGNWQDAARWDVGSVPNENDRVVISAGAGVITLRNDVKVWNLLSNGGLIQGDESFCPDDWMSNPTVNPSTKCYKKFETVQDFNSAEATCRTSTLGSMDSHLVQISNAEELLVVQRLCRGQVGNVVTRTGCWIGLSDPDGVGKYAWLQPETVRNNSYRDWRRYEYNNHTFSEGQATNGELCVQMVPWQADALIKEQGSFNDVACKLQKAFVCQIFAKTERYSITVVSSTWLNAGGISGGSLFLEGITQINNFQALRGSTISIKKTAFSVQERNILQRLIMEDGSELNIDADFSTKSAAYIGEMRDLASPTSELHMQPNFAIGAGATWVTENTNYDIDIEARVKIFAAVKVSEGINFNLNQGGSLSQSTFTLTGDTTYLNLGGGSQMSTYDAYELKVQHRGEVIGEYRNNYGFELPNPGTGVFNTSGVFRLVLSGGTPHASQITKCIPYHSTAQELATILSRLPLVQDRGGITVRRYGAGDDPFFGFGYTYRIEMDAPSTASFDLGSLKLEIQCYGRLHNCGCSETKVPMVDSSGQRMCLRQEGNSSRVDGNACIVPPIINVMQLTQLSYTRTFGKGSIIIDTGVHRLPPKSDVLISSASTGLGIVGADYIKWGGIAVDGVGTIIAAGTGWASWDAASVLFGPDWWDVRGYVRMLNSAPAFNMYVDVFVLAGLGSILTASPRSNMTWTQGAWNGGTVGGRSRLNILGTVTAQGTNKALKYGITMMIHEGAKFIWSSGNISLSNGASIICEGTFDLRTIGERKFIGESHLLDSSVPAYRELLKVEPKLQWHGYFGLELPSELRGGFYTNPLCGDQCDRENYMWFRENATCLFASNSNTSFNLPLNLLGSSRVTMGLNAYVEMASGGICGNSVIVDISSGTIFSFSGGQMSMRATCKVQGKGELLIAGGAHDMSFSIDSHITIAGGIMIWPFSRGPGFTITFNGGLEIRAKGRLQIEPYSTKIVVYGEVLLKDECVLQYPMLGTAAQATNSDRPDAPDTTPRGSLTAVNKMTWAGGMLRGKADFISEGVLFISGGLKQIRSLAKLVNKGYAEWLSGDILMADNADFMNLGTVQMAKGNMFFDANNLYQGTVLPTENGGDVFALEFHSYDLDSGWLSYLDYVNLRTQFVSRAPFNWTEADQDLKILTPSNIV